MTLFGPINAATAIISQCGRYRYAMTRHWAPERLFKGQPWLWIMLNPSTADADKDDATVRKCIRFSQAGEAAMLTIANLYAFRSRDPVRLRKLIDPIGPENDRHLGDLFRQHRLADGVLIFAWGHNHMGEAGLARIAEVRRMAGAAHLTPYCFGYTQADAKAPRQPRHPLMLSYATPIERYNP